MADSAGAGRQLMSQSSKGRNRIPVTGRNAGAHEGMVPLVFLPTLRALILVLAALAITLCLPSFAKSVRPEPQTSPEALLNGAFEDIARQRFDAALGNIEALIRARPNFRLAHLIKGDLLLAKARPLATLGDAPNGPAERIVDLREEAVARLRAYREPHSSDQVPSYLLQLLPEQKYAIIVDTGRSRLYLFQNRSE